MMYACSQPKDFLWTDVVAAVASYYCTAQLEEDEEMNAYFYT